MLDITFSRILRSVGLLLTLLFSIEVNANLIFYTDKALFDAASTTSTTAFSTPFGDSVVGSPGFTVDGNTYSATNGSSLAICPATSCAGSPFDSALIITNSPSAPSIRVDLGTAATAVGGLFGDSDGPVGAGILNLYGPGNTLLDTQTVTYGDMGAGLPKTFFGWTSTAGDTFAALDFAVNNQAPRAFEAIDNFQFGTANSSTPDPGPSPDPGPAPVPAPATLALLGLGLLGLRLRRIA